MRDYPREIVDRLDYLSTAAVFKHETPEELGEFINIFARPRGRLEVLENFSRNRMVYLGGDVAGSVDATSAALGLIQRLVKAGECSNMSLTGNAVRHGVGEIGSRVPLVILELLLARLLGPAIYGLWSVVHTVIQYGNFLHFGRYRLLLGESRVACSK